MRKVMRCLLRCGHRGRRRQTLGRYSARSVFVDSSGLTPNYGVAEGYIICSHDLIINIEVLYWLAELYPLRFLRAYGKRA